MKRIFTFFLSLIALAFFSTAAFAQNNNESIRKAGEFLNRGDVRGAIAVLDKAVEKKKDLLEIYKMRSFLRPMTGDFAGAVADLSAAIEIKPDDGELYERRAMWRLNLGQNNSLILKDFDSAIAYGRKVERVYAFRATVKRQMGDDAGAIEDYQTAIGMRPDYAQANVGLASIYLVNGDEEKAASILENFLADFENSGKKAPKLKGEVVASSATVLPDAAQKGALTGVQITILQRSEMSAMPTPEEIQKRGDKMEQTKNTALAYANLARIYAKRGDIEKALSTVEKSIKLDPTDFYPLSVRGEIRTKQNDFAGAVVDFNQAIKMMPSFAVHYLERGIAFLMWGKTAEAQADFDKYLQLFPQGKPTYEKRIAEAKQKMSENGSEPK